MRSPAYLILSVKMVHRWSVYGLGKSKVKFWTAKFHLGIMQLHTICTNQFHAFTKKQLQISGWNSLAGNTGPPFQELFLLEVFNWNDPRDLILCHLLSNWILRNSFINSKLPFTLRSSFILSTLPIFIYFYF